MAALFEKPFIKDQARYISDSAPSIFTAVEAVEKKDYYPVSAAQKRMYVLNRFAPDSVNYNMPGGRLIEGDLSTIHFEEASQKLIHRHESLRTSFHLINGKPVQRIHDNIVFPVEFTTGVTADSCFTQFLRPFDLSLVPLVRIELVKLEENKHLFLFDMHHIISDGVSRGILIKELSDLYADLELKPLSVQYKNYAAWQNRFLQSPRLVQQKNHWLEKFSGEIPVLSMPTDFPRAAVQSFEGKTIAFSIDEKLTGAIHRLAPGSGSTLYMLLLSIYTILLSKYSGQVDIIVGSPSAGLGHTDLENIIGMFVNTLAMSN
ncbi:MAG: hypothetical protein GY940_22855, partial [bacterium]|nr:hypothetical protein [bacterium]